MSGQPTRNLWPDHSTEAGTLRRGSPPPGLSATSRTGPHRMSRRRGACAAVPGGSCAGEGCRAGPARQPLMHLKDRVERERQRSVDRSAGLESEPAEARERERAVLVRAERGEGRRLGCESSWRSRRCLFGTEALASRGSGGNATRYDSQVVCRARTPRNPRSGAILRRHAMRSARSGLVRSS